ncbi:sigma factor-like helix-turn-helix DNA-binding protein, partial [Aliarcobacter butzleri]
YKVARNLTFDYSKKNKNKQFIEYDDERNFCSKEEEPDEVLMETKKDELLLEALESLPQYLKEVFVLHFFDGLDKKQIAV